MLPAILLLLLGLWSAMANLNAFRPFRRTVLLFPSMVWSWIVIGLPGLHVAIQMVIAGALVWWGALDHTVGWIGLVVLLASWVGSAILLVKSRRSRGVVDEALGVEGIARSGVPVPSWRILVAAPFRGRRVEKIKSVPFRRVAGRILKLDVYRDRTGATTRPALLYIHGGGWTVGDKREQGLPLLQHMARNGWVCFSANYRLSPGATFPDHLSDVKAALVWIREHGAECGADPRFIAVSGGSAGGHLAALVGLTENDARYQRGFESADTSVEAVVPIYGVYDVTNRLGAQSDQFLSLLMEPLVIKAFLEDEPDKFRDASPLDRVHPDVPPFLVIQGDRDSLAPVVEARAFVEHLREQSRSRVVYMEFPGVQHIFDIFYSYQSAQMVEGVLAFLDDTYTRFRIGESADQPD
ncbi:MAG: alpha/beta hydrolase [Acidimicrobiia bacterium]|nr:alpha/beta hydrolase [Acidimicrobiia bacterium]